MKMSILAAAAVLCILPFSSYAQSGKGGYAGGPRGEEIRRGGVTPRARAGRVQVRRGRGVTRRGMVVDEPRGPSSGKGGYAGGPLGAERRR